MSNQASNKLTITNMLEGGKAPAPIECQAGQICLLEDAEGTYLENYKQALTGKPCQHRIVLDHNGQSLDLSKVAYVGFDNTYPEGCTIRQVLLQRNLSEQDADQTIEQFELERFGYLFASQLAAPQARQLELILALRFDQSIIVLNDPFQPLNGRWREEYGRLILERVLQNQLIAVCINISFIPQAWISNNCINRFDLSKCANKALERYVLQQRTEREKLRDKEKELEKKALKAAPAAVEEAKPAAKVTTKIDPVTGKEVVHYELPENLTFAYRCTRDYIFEPLAEISTFLARYHLIVGVFGFAIMIVLMATIMFPDVRSQFSRLIITPETPSEIESEPVITADPGTSVVPNASASPVASPSAIPLEENPDAETGPAIDPVVDPTLLNTVEAQQSEQVVEVTLDNSLQSQPDLAQDYTRLNFEFLTDTSLDLASSSCILQANTLSMSLGSE